MSAAVRAASGRLPVPASEKIVLEVRGNDGRPLANVQVDAFQLMSEGPQAGTIMGVSRNEPLYSAATDAEGRLALMDLPAPAHETPAGYTLRPNPFGKIAWTVERLLLLRLRSADREECYFVRLFDCNVAYLRGLAKEYIVPYARVLAAPDAPAAPLYAAVKVDDRTGARPPMYLRWPLRGLDIDPRRSKSSECTADELRRR